MVVTGANIYSLIFREDFAKALWGEEVYIWDLAGRDIPAWRNELRLLIDAEYKWEFIEKSIL